MIAIAAGMPMNSAEVCSRCLATVMRYHRLANVTARMIATKFHRARRVLSSSIASPQWAVAACGLRAKSIARQVTRPMNMNTCAVANTPT